MRQDAVITAKAGTHLPLPFAFYFLNDKGENESKLGSSFRWMTVSTAVRAVRPARTPTRPTLYIDSSDAAHIKNLAKPLHGLAIP
ncbi:hypothetical protein ACI2IY_22095 [Lysobacter enzymogenes]|uniref:hypothetical protein n=1 Tax=Lysobacter enzymogenes TaxID=69 RepID=UPI00384CC41E